MPRRPRPAFSGAVYHITARGNNGEPIFRDTQDRAGYLRLLKQMVHGRRVRLLAYVLMTNHVHLVVQTPEPNISAALQELHGVYAARYNRKYHRTGHLFSGRFGARLIDSDSYLLESTRYVHRNPVQAGLVNRPEAYTWTSYRTYFSESAGPPFVDPRPVLDLLADHRPTARAAYARFVSDVTAGARPVPAPIAALAIEVSRRVADLLNVTVHELWHVRRYRDGRAIVLRVLHTVHRVACRDLAEFTGMKLGTVYSALNHARRLAGMHRETSADPLVEGAGLRSRGT